MFLLRNLHSTDLESYILSRTRKILLIAKPNCKPCLVFKSCLAELSELLSEQGIEVAMFMVNESSDFKSFYYEGKVRFFPSLLLVGPKGKVEAKLLGALIASDKVNSLRIIRWLEKNIE